MVASTSHAPTCSGRESPSHRPTLVWVCGHRATVAARRSVEVRRRWRQGSGPTRTWPGVGIEAGPRLRPEYTPWGLAVNNVVDISSGRSPTLGSAQKVAAHGVTPGDWSLRGTGLRWSSAHSWGTPASPGTRQVGYPAGNVVRIEHRRSPPGSRPPAHSANPRREPRSAHGPPGPAREPQ